MQIQPITAYRSANVYKKQITRKTDEPQPDNQPNFKGIKGLLKGVSAGAGVTAGGVALIAGVAAVPLFLSYIAVNGIIAGAAGHMIEKHSKENKN